MCVSDRYSQLKWVPNINPPLINGIVLGSSHLVPSNGTQAKWIDSLYIHKSIIILAIHAVLHVNPLIYVTNYCSNWNMLTKGEMLERWDELDMLHMGTKPAGYFSGLLFGDCHNLTNKFDRQLSPRRKYSICWEGCLIIHWYRNCLQERTSRHHMDFFWYHGMDNWRGHPT